jgi:hypothetical protein
LFQQIREVHRPIVECGVFRGVDLFSWSNLSAIFEPYNHVRRIVGFGTFQGFPAVSDDDVGGPMPKGSVIAFDELNQQFWPRETMAVLD